MIAGFTAAVAVASPEAELKALEQQWVDAYSKGDTVALKTIEAEDWTFVNSDGLVQTKAQDIKDLADKNFILKSSSIIEMNVKMLGDNVAYVTSLWRMNGATYKGTDMSGDYRTLDILEKKDNKWQARYSQLTKVKK